MVLNMQREHSSCLTKKKKKKKHWISITIFLVGSSRSVPAVPAGAGEDGAGAGGWWEHHPGHRQHPGPGRCPRVRREGGKEGENQLFRTHENESSIVVCLSSVRRMLGWSLFPLHRGRCLAAVRAVEEGIVLALFKDHM